MGGAVSWALTGVRSCTGVWAGAQRRPCPEAEPLLLDGTDPQCANCASLDRGRQIARDAELGDDGRDYTLYLAWFGPGLMKVGLTATDRGRDRLLEQGAIAWTPAAAGPYTPVRHAERLIARAGLARERFSGHAKTAAWWNLEPPPVRAAHLAAAHKLATGKLARYDRISPAACSVTDQAGDFGLAPAGPPAYREVTGISSSAVLTGMIQMTIGHWLLLDTVTGMLLIDMRRVAGCQFNPADAAATPAGLRAVSRSPLEARNDQQFLF